MATRFLIYSLLLSALLSCSNEKQKDNTVVNDQVELGQINIDISCSEKASPLFQEGLLLLHSFQFDDAAEKFQEAYTIDSTCAMAYWGEAMSKNHPLWREQDKAEAIEVLDKLGSTKETQRENFKTDFEKDMFDAICILYGEGTKKENDKAYSDFMKTLYEKYPDQHEVRAFYALSLLGSNENGREKELYGKGAKIAQSIIDENPHHPGALHYLIHSYDDPDNAPKALDAANSYSKVAPDASHALHMPSHIYVAMGMWDDVISSNEAAVAASVKRRERKDLEIKKIDFHSLKWLMYGHLQKGEFQKAKDLVVQMEDYCEQEHSSKAVSHTVMMKAAYLTETNNWDDPLLQDSIDYSDVPIQIFGTRSYMLGMEAFHKQNKDSILTLIANMNPEIADAREEALISSSAMCSGSYQRGRPTENNVKRTEVVQMQLKTLVAMLDNDNQKVEQLLLDAIELEEKTTYMYGPPEIVKPTHEMYAEWLQSQERNQEAIASYQEVLKRAPKRYIPSKALENLNNSE